jgi:hypothetical protein
MPEGRVGGKPGAITLVRLRAHSSAGERPLHTREVPGSIPGAPTMERPWKRGLSKFLVGNRGVWLQAFLQAARALVGVDPASPWHRGSRLGIKRQTAFGSAWAIARRARPSARQ